MDENGNGIFDPEETGVPDYQIELYHDAEKIAETVSGEEGEYIFDSLAPGNYVVTFLIATGMERTTDSEYEIELEENEIILRSFGVQEIETVYGEINGVVFEDLNLNGEYDLGEPNMDGGTVTLYDAYDEYVSETAAGDGLYSFDSVESGIYDVTLTIPMGTFNTTRRIVTIIVFGNDVNEVNFGVANPEEISLSGSVFDDRDGDGVIGTGESGLGEVQVQLWSMDTLLMETITDENGEYSFTGLNALVYTVVEIQPEGWFSTTPDLVEVDLQEGDSAEVEFGDTQGASIQGNVFNDKNQNMINDGEDGVNGVTVLLKMGEIIIAEEETEANGRYSFTVIVAGSYEVVESDRMGWTSTTSNEVEVEIESLTGQIERVDFGDYKRPSPPPPPPPPPKDKGTIKCFVFEDEDADGVWDDEESPVPGVAVDLYEDGVKLKTVFTDEDGVASFGQYNVGDYEVVETDKENWGSTTPNEVLFSLSSGETKEIEFGDNKGAFFQGVVYNDEDEDGERDVEEEGIEGVLVSLYLSEELVDETYSTVGGLYSFMILEPGNYMVEETDLEDWKSSTPNQVAASVAGLEGQVYEADYGDYEYPFGDIWGIAFDDEDVDGEKDAEESGIEGVVVSIYDDGGLVAATTTDEDGEYSFTELTPGVYEVRAGYVSNHFRTTPGSVMPEVEVGDEKEVNFGYVYVENPYGVIYGTVFNDKDGDMGRSFGELGLSGVDVSLWLTEVQLNSETTNEYGCYSIRIDAADTYRLVETDPDGWHSTTPNEYTIAASTANDNDSPWDFGDTLGATISGIVWEDVNRDGVIDTVETGIEGVLVELYLGQVLVDDTLTAGDGSYSFLVLATGDYVVEETDPEGYGSSTSNDLHVSIGELVGQTHVSKDFGDYVLKSSVTGIVFNDLDGSGVQDDGEQGIVGVTVSLYDESDVFVDLEQTDENGEYLFELSILGRYKVEETNPQGYTSTTSDIVVVDLSEDEEETVNFGDRIGIEFAGIYGIVWNDENGNGNREVELGIPDVTVNLYTMGEPNTFIESKTTNKHGQYTFTGLSIDDYLVEEINPDGWTSTTPDEVTVPIVDFTTIEVEYGDIYPNPSIGVWKYVIDPTSFDELESVTVLTGTVVEYKFVVGNDGNVPVTDIVLVDDVLGTISLPLSTLNPGEAMIGGATHEINEDTINTATVTATYVTPEEEEVEISDEDSASCYIGTIGLMVTKEVGSTGEYLVDDDWSHSAQILIGDTVYYRFTVENTGSLPLEDLTVVDDVLGPIPFGASTLLPGEKMMNSEPVSETAESGEHSDTVTATGYWNSIEVSGTDSASYTGVYIEASLDLKVKGVDGSYYDYDAPVKAGEKVTYQYTITNIGTADLTGLGGNDDDGNDLNLPSSVAAGASVTVEYTSSSDALPGPHSNSMSFYSSESKGAAIAWDDTSYFAEEAGVEITKEIYCRTSSAWLSEDAQVIAGEPVEFRFTVENTGNVELTKIIVTDNSLGTITMPGTSLSPGGEMYAEVSDTAAPGTHSNIVTVTGDTSIQTVSDEDDSYYDGWSPSISLTKEVSIDDVNWYDYVEVTVGDTVYYRFTVENTGDVDLHDVYIEDLALGDFDVGDLGSGEIEYGYKDSVATDGLHENTATASGYWSGLLTPFESTDSASYFGVDASIEVEKKVKGGDDNWYDGPVDLLTGDPAEFQYTVTNKGNVVLSGVTVVDDVLGPVTLDETTLAPGQTAMGTITSTVLGGLNTNMATATGHYAAATAPNTEWDPMDEDSSSYFGGIPSVSLSKEVQDIDGNWVESATLPEGGTASYRFVITNTGDVGLSGISVYDPDLLVTGYDADLPPGETTTGYADATVLYDLNPNEAHVEAYWSSYDVEDDDSAAYTGVQAYLQLTKLVKGEDGLWHHDPETAYVAAGEPVEFRYIIDNMCELPFTDVTLWDDRLGWITLSSTNIPGWGQIDYTVTDPVAIVGDYHNQAEAQGKCGDYTAPPFIDFASYYGVDMSVTVDKQIKDPDGLWVDDTYAKAGETVEYRFVVENTGTEGLASITLEDDALGTIGVPVSWLAPGGSFTTDPVTATASEGTHSNTVTVMAYLDMIWVYGFDPVSDTDTASYTGGVMGMTLTKEASTDNVNWYPHVDILMDDTVYFRFTLENTGNVELVDVNGYDYDLGTAIEFEDTTLALGATTVNKYPIWVYALPDHHENTGEAYAMWNGVQEKAEGTASYFGVDVDTLFRKEVRIPGDDWRDDIVYVKTGDDVEFRFVIENYGNVDLTDVVIDDPDLLVHIDVGTVASGATYYSPVETVTALEGTHTNTATCNGETLLGPFAMLEDSASYEGEPLTVSVKVDKQVWDPFMMMWSDSAVFKVGDEVRYRVYIENTGEADLENLEAYDSTYGFYFDLLSTTLASGASMTSSEKTMLAEEGPHENTVTVTGDAVSPGVGTADDTDTASYMGELIASISLDKQIWDPVMMDWSDGPVTYTVGELVRYRVVVTNDGNFDLHDVMATDTTLGQPFMLRPFLAQGQYETSLELTDIAQESLHENEAVVSAIVSPPGFGIVEDTDTAIYEGVYDHATIGGTVWNDLNKDGVFDPGEPGKEGVTVTLSGDGSDVDTTDVDGVYGFTVYTAGDYTVTVSIPTGWEGSTPDAVDVPVALGDSETADFGIYEKPLQVEAEYYLAYEDACDNEFKDYGMTINLKEYYQDDYLTLIEMTFTSITYDSKFDHLIHIKTEINGPSTVTVTRVNPIPSSGPLLGKDETPEGVYAFDGDVDVILFNTMKYTFPQKHIGEVVLVTIEVADPYQNPKPVDPELPRVFNNEAPASFYDLDPVIARYDPWLESNSENIYTMSTKLTTEMFGLPAIEVPRILTIPNLDWIPPYYDTVINMPYGYWDDYYRYGEPDDWWTPEMVTVNVVGLGGLSWGPYP